MKSRSGVRSISPAFAPMLLGAVLAIVAFGAGVVVAALVFAATAGYVVILVGVGVVIAAVGAICGWAFSRIVVDLIGSPSRASERRHRRPGALGGARVRARRSLGRGDGQG